jgi:hypothetical protein
MKKALYLKYFGQYEIKLYCIKLNYLLYIKFYIYVTLEWGAK